MNYKLSVYANRPSEVCNVELVKGNVVLKSYTGRFMGGNIKENILRGLEKGLRLAATTVSHEDLLCIELQNRHVVDWMQGKREYKGYNEWLDLATESLDLIDCQYSFIFSENPRAKRGSFILKTSDERLNTVGVADMMEEFEG